MIYRGHIDFDKVDMMNVKIAGINNRLVGVGVALVVVIPVMTALVQGMIK
jgi:hypothetical protein